MRSPFRLVTDRGLTPAAGLQLVGATGLTVAAVAAVVLVWLAASGGNSEDVLINAGISGVLVVGYQIFVGNTGIVSFGHIAFMGIGAYVGGILMVPPDLKLAVLPDLPFGLGSFSLSIVPAMLVAGGIAALVGLVSGVV